MNQRLRLLTSNGARLCSRTLKLNASGHGRRVSATRAVARLLLFAALFALTLGSLCHQPGPSFQIENISNNLTLSQYPSIACTQDGHVAIAWSDSATGQENIWLVEKTSGSSWTQPVNISNASEPSRSPWVAFGPDGVLHLAWSQFVTREEFGGWVIVCQSRIGSQWTPAETLSRGLSVEPRLAVDGSGRLHLLFWDISDEVCYSSKAPESSWMQVQVLDKAILGGEGGLAVDAVGRCYATWHADTFADVIRYSVKPANGPWASPRFVGSGVFPDNPVVACRDTSCYLAFSALVAGSGLGVMRTTVRL